MYCVDLGESFHKSSYLQKSASIPPRTSPVKFARSPRTDPPGDDDNIGECVKTEPFKECHFACMAKSDIDQETQSDVKFKRFISSMFDRVGNFLGSS